MTKGTGPGGKHEHMRTYTPDEAALVMQLVEAHQPRWTHIAKLVSDAMGCERTAASIRNYYKRFQESKRIAERDSAIKKLNRCQICGQIKRGHICRKSFVTPENPGAGTGSAAMADSLATVKEGAIPIAASSAEAFPTLDVPTVPLGPPSASGGSRPISPPAEGLLALSGPSSGPMPPLAPAALAPAVLEVSVTTPGASPLSLATLSANPFSASTWMASPMQADLGLHSDNGGGRPSFTRPPTSLNLVHTVAALPADEADEVDGAPLLCSVGGEDLGKGVAEAPLSGPPLVCAEIAAASV